MDTSGLKNQLSNRLKVALQNEAEEEERKKSKLNFFSFCSFTPIPRALGEYEE